MRLPHVFKLQYVMSSRLEIRMQKYKKNYVDDIYVIPREVIELKYVVIAMGRVKCSIINRQTVTPNTCLVLLG